jgi:hypothetical protein
MCTKLDHLFEPFKRHAEHLFDPSQDGSRHAGIEQVFETSVVRDYREATTRLTTAPPEARHGHEQERLGFG